METVDLSIIIVSYNTRELLCECLRSVHQTSQGLTTEVIVVDNASQDGSAEMVKQTFPQVTLMQNSHNLGFAKAANQGLRIVVGEFILLLNSDTEVKAEALQRCIKFFGEHRDAGIVGCKLLNSDGSLQPSCENFPDFKSIFFESFFLEKLFPHSRLFGRMHLTYFGYDRIKKVGYVKGAFLMIRCQAFEQIGLLDEKFFFYAEEMDWCYRAKLKGWEVYFTPDAEVIHYGGQSSDPISPRLFVQLHKSRYQFYRKYHSALPSAAARGVLAAGALLRLFGWTVAMLHNRIFQPTKGTASPKKIAAHWAAFRWYLGQNKNLVF